jgi:hypothetical protein
MTQRAAQAENLDRAVPLSSVVDGAADFWTEVHEQVQRQLAVLETEVRGRVAGVRVDQGKTQGKQFYLFSYRTFTVPNSGLDPVVSGITFAAAEEGVTIEADISGERTGDLIFSVASKTVANRREEVLAATDEVARKLCQSAEAIAAPLRAGPPS